jgi:hypothetical protein
MSKSKVEVTPKDIAKSLDKISAWVRGVRSAVLKMEKTSTVKLPRRFGGGAAAAAPPGMLDGCPPVPRPPKPSPVKKKKSK